MRHNQATIHPHTAKTREHKVMQEIDYKCLIELLEEGSDCWLVLIINELLGTFDAQHDQNAGSAVGAVSIADVVLGGHGGALAGTVIGASAISVHLPVSHPLATLESGAALLIALSEPLNLAPAASAGNQAAGNTALHRPGPPQVLTSRSQSASEFLRNKMN
jgi:hypothetical protein